MSNSIFKISIKKNIILIFLSNQNIYKVIKKKYKTNYFIIKPSNRHKIQIILKILVANKKK